MENFLIINDTIRNRISYYHLLIFIVLLPYDLVYSELVLISLAIHTAIQFRLGWLQKNRIRLLYPAIVYLLTIGGLLYSLDIQQANKDLEKQLAILLFPLIMLLNDIDYSKYLHRLLLAFGLSCIVAILYLFIDALRIIEYFHLPYGSLFSPSFTNHNFSSPIGLHATYFSMYISLSIATFLYFLLRSRQVLERFVLILCMAVLIAGLIQLQSRATFIATLLIVNLLFPLLMLKTAARKKYFVFSVFFSIVVIVVLVSIDSFKYRYVTDFRKDLTVNRSLANQPETRMARWLQAWQLIRKSPVIGYGTGSEGKVLRQKYFEAHFYVSYVLDLNAHNEYISILLKFGIVGLAIYLWVLYKSFLFGFQAKDILFLSFLIIIVTVSMSENILDVNKGIFFFSFLMSCFLQATVHIPPMGKNDKNRYIRQFQLSK